MSWSTQLLNYSSLPLTPAAEQYAAEQHQRWRRQSKERHRKADVVFGLMGQCSAYTHQWSQVLCVE